MQMAEANTLEYYLANPEEMPDNLSELEASLNKEPEPKEEDVKEESAPSDAEAKEEVKVEEAPEEAPKLLSKNGKDEIPYQVLVSERERRAAAEKAAQDLRNQLAEIEARVKVGEQKQEAPRKEDAIDIDKLAEDFPEVGVAIKSLQAQVAEANQRLQAVVEIEQERQVREVQTARNRVQEAIDGNPVLSYWQNESPEMFNKAVQLDDALRQDSVTASLSMEQRFEKVVKAMTAIYGEPELPGNYKPAAPKTEDMNGLTEKAKEVVKKTESFKPRSLSDIPGGTPPASNERDKLQNMSQGQLAAMMHDMDADQINSLIARLG